MRYSATFLACRYSVLWRDPTAGEASVRTRSGQHFARLLSPHHRCNRILHPHQQQVHGSSVPLCPEGCGCRKNTAANLASSLSRSFSPLPWQAGRSCGRPWDTPCPTARCRYPRRRCVAIPCHGWPAPCGIYSTSCTTGSVVASKPDRRRPVQTILEYCIPQICARRPPLLGKAAAAETSRGQQNTQRGSENHGTGETRMIPG